MCARLSGVVCTCAPQGLRFLEDRRAHVCRQESTGRLTPVCWYVRTREPGNSNEGTGEKVINKFLFKRFPMCGCKYGLKAIPEDGTGIRPEYGYMC